MKKNKGFTLIELLAIIVILAIIAVITVPIILNIIENSKIGAASDSAYGYKDAINKWYVSKLSSEPNFNIEDGTYTTDNLKELGVALSGKEPGTNSWVSIEKNNVKTGCLQFDEYKVEIEDGKVTTTEKGECEEYIEPLPCPGPNCVYAYYTTSKNYGPNGTGSVLTDYTTDYTTLSEHHGVNVDNYFFLGHILDSNGKIERGFVCGMESNGKPFCIEGTTDGSKHNQNISVLESTLFENFSGTCYGSSAFYPCSNENGTAYIGFNMPTGTCNVEKNGTMYCETH